MIRVRGAPVTEEFPLTMECEVTAIDGDEHGARIVGSVVNTRVDESVLGEEVGGARDAGKVLR